MMDIRVSVMEYIFATLFWICVAGCHEGVKRDVDRLYLILMYFTLIAIQFIIFMSKFIPALFGIQIAIVIYAYIHKVKVYRVMKKIGLLDEENK